MSTSAPLIREADAPTLAIAFWRNAFAVLALWPVVGLRHRKELADLGRLERRRCIVAGLWLGAHFATWIPSLSYTSVASSVALVATQPVWAALVARWRGERVPRQAWTGIGIALAGVVLLAGVDLSLSARALFGDALALAGGILAAAYVTVGADARRTVSTTVYTAICYSVAAGLLGVACLGGGRAADRLRLPHLAAAGGHDHRAAAPRALCGQPGPANHERHSGVGRHPLRDRRFDVHGLGLVR